MKKSRKLYLIIVAMLLCLGLAACSKEESVVSEAEPTETGIEVSGEEAEDIAGKVEETSTEVVESTLEDTEDAELYIPEGIDMESTLPGEEWICTFENNVKEPVVVVFSDITGRKEVVQANSEIMINPDEDLFGIYWPEFGMGETTYAISSAGTILPKHSDGTYMDLAHIIPMDSKKMRDIPERPAKVTVMGGEEDWVIEFTILVQ